MTITAPPLRPNLTEDEWKAIVIDFAKLHGWRVHHMRPALKADGEWYSPIEGDPGFPDLVLARGGTVLLVELKSNKGGMRPGQLEWIAAAESHGRLWRPRDWDIVQQQLREA